MVSYVKKEVVLMADSRRSLASGGELKEPAVGGLKELIKVLKFT